MEGRGGKLPHDSYLTFFSAQHHSEEIVYFQKGTQYVQLHFMSNINGNDVIFVY